MRLLSILLISINLFAQVDIVFDIDWTLVYPIKDISSIQDKTKVFAVGEDYYRLADGASEVINELSKKNDVRISFFSGGSEYRNLQLLKQIKLPDSKTSLLDIAYKVLSKKDLTIISNNSSLKFTQRYKKDLTKVNPNLKNIVLIDDLKGFLLPHQSKNIIWLEQTFEFTDFFEKNKNKKFYPKDFAVWMKERHKMYRIYSRIEKTLKKISFNSRSFTDQLSLTKPDNFISVVEDFNKKYPSISDLSPENKCFLIFLP